ncbi:hypothetical protein SuNHUV7_25830 (plasmid) [Pseudoseohaeicola sp. NH-UV-7]
MKHVRDGAGSSLFQKKKSSLGFWKKFLIASIPVFALVFGNVFLTPVFVTYPVLLFLALSAPLLTCMAGIFLLHRLNLNDTLVIGFGALIPWVTWYFWGDFAYSTYVEYFGDLPRIGGR